MMPAAWNQLRGHTHRLAALSRSHSCYFEITSRKSSSRASHGPQLGDTFTTDKVFSEAEVRQFLASTGDANPLHVDPAAAAEHGFARPILPGILMASLFPAVIGTAFPGALYVTQSLSFRCPALVGDRVQAVVTVTKRSGSRIVFGTQCISSATGAVLLDGSAMALLPAAPKT